MAIASSFSTPVGTVLMWAGSTGASSITALGNAGWLVCDGSTHSCNGQYQELFYVIGEAFGGDAGSFALPTFQGMFLRGVNGTANVDPEALYRAAPRPDLSNAGNKGNNVGSVQMDQLASHLHQYQYPNSYHKTTGGIAGHSTLSGQKMVSMNETHGGYGNETRPVNQYVNFIIKCTSAVDIIPPGVVMPFAGDISNAATVAALEQAGWLPCTGSKLNAQNYSQLSAVISNFYGADDLSNFYLPDFRGRFLRGVQGTPPSGMSIMDPDNQTRLSPTNKVFPGNKSNAVGSLQNSDFLSHTHQYYYSGSNNWHTGDCTADDSWDTGSRMLDSESNSSAQESRPVNIYVNFIIKT